jgi:hypothetical protein
MFLQQHRLTQQCEGIVGEHAIVEELLEAMFSMQSTPRLYTRQWFSVETESVCRQSVLARCG